MSLPIIRRVRTFQPGGVVPVDRNHPFLAGVNRSIVLSGDVGGWTYNNGRAVPNPIINGALASGATDIGAALKFNGSTNYLDFGILNIAEEFTVFWGGALDGLSGATGIVDCSDGSTSGWSLFTSGTDMYLSGNRWQGNLLSTGWTAGAFHHGAARNKTGVGSAIFRNGVKIASDTFSLTSAVANPVNNFWVGQLRVSGPRFITARFAYFYLFDRYLDDAAIASIQSNPWQIFESRVLRVETAGGAGGSPQTITGVVATPSSSVSTPTLTAGSVTFSPPRPTPTSNAGTPTLTAGGVTLSLSAAVPSSNVSTPTLSNGNASIIPAVAIASSSASTPTLSGTNTLNVTAPTPSSNAGVPSLTAGSVALAPAGAIASSNASVPTLQNGSSLAPAAAIATSSAGVPTLTAGSKSFSPPAPIASSSVNSGTLIAGAVAVTPAAAIATSAGVVPDASSGSTLTPAVAIASSSVSAPSLVAGVAPLTTLAAVATSGGVIPSFAQTGFLVPAVAICGSFTGVPLLFNSGAGRSLERLLEIDAETRSFIVNAEERLYLSPSERRIYS